MSLRGFCGSPPPPVLGAPRPPPPSPGGLSRLPLSAGVRVCVLTHVHTTQTLQRYVHCVWDTPHYGV